jgi:glycosyltransferase involved in cell wall biosynthesis
VIIPVYNGQETVSRAIDSALKQTYPQREIIVVDDGSTDSTLELLRGYGPTIQLVKQEHSGISIARNTGLSIARGEYIAFLDCDDTWIPEKLQLQVEILRKYPSVGLTFGNLEMVSRNGEKLGSTTLASSRRYSPSWEDILVRFALSPGSAMGRKDLMIKSGGFDPAFVEPGYEDTDFFLRLREITDFHYLDMCVGCYYFDQARSMRYLSNLLLYAGKQWKSPRLQTPANDRLRDEFVASRATHLSNYARLLLRLEGNEVSSEMLAKLNGFHESFESLFGESYKRVTGLDSITLSRYELNPAVTLLLYLYLCRPDLQTAFPDVRSGDISNLVDWGTSVAQSKENVYSDSDRPILLAHLHELEQLTEKSKGSTGLISRLRTLIKAVGFRSH